jgi:hypothetical protein
MPVHVPTDIGEPQCTQLIVKPAQPDVPLVQIPHHVVYVPALHETSQLLAPVKQDTLKLGKLLVKPAHLDAVPALLSPPAKNA